MLKVCLVLVVSALCLAQAMEYRTYTADMDFLHKQKKIFELFFYIGQNSLMDAEFFEIGRNYDLKNNAELYTNKEAYQEFIYLRKQGFLNRDAMFSPYYREHREECRSLYNMLYHAKDFATFYKTACYARLHMNQGTFICAFTSATLYRNDTKMMRLPEMWEIYPYLYFDSKIIQDAQRIKMARGNTFRNYELGMKRTSGMESADSFLIYANYTGACCKYDYTNGCGEYKLDYFMEDIGLNNFYFFFRIAFPFWIDSRNLDLPKDFRGKFYMYIHQQLMARYNLERYSNDMGEVEYTDWYKYLVPGFYSSLSYPNGIAMPYRDEFTRIPTYKNKYVKEIESLEFRIFNAIDSGFIRDYNGKELNIYTPDGLNSLGNLIEGNGDSCNRQYYGSFEALARNLLGFNFERKCKNYFVPSSLQLFSSSMRDPMFYRLNKKLVNFMLKYQEHMPAYHKDELFFNGIKIESVNMDKLITYFEYYDATINNAVTVESMKDGRSFNIKARQYRLNHKPFTYRMTINSDKETKALCRIFLGPADNSGDNNEFSFFYKNYMNYFKLDKFIINLKPGMNNIDRHSTESSFMKPDRSSAETFYRKIRRAMEGNEPFTYSDNRFGFPQRLMLPIGKPEGMRFKMFFYIYPYTESKAFDIPMFGKFYDDGKPFGFPLDKPIRPSFFDMPNAYFRDVRIYNMKDDMNDMRDTRDMRDMRESDRIY